MQISLEDALNTHDIRTKGLIHLGINTGQEIPHYLYLGFNTQLLVEAIDEHVQVLREQYPPEKFPGLRFVSCAVTDQDGTVEINIASNNSESSSILPFKEHAGIYPTVSMVGKRTVPARRLDSLVPDPTAYNVLVMDIQGAELLALKGASAVLDHIELVITEVALVELYAGCALHSDIDEYLAARGMVHVATQLEHPTWGDALYVRDSILSRGAR